MKNFKFYVSALLVAGILAVGTISCVDDKESASVERIRNEKANLLKAEAELASAQATAALIMANAEKALKDAQIAVQIQEAAIKEAIALGEKSKADSLAKELGIKIKGLELTLQQQQLEYTEAVEQNKITLEKLKAQLLVEKAGAASYIQTLIGKYSLLITEINGYKSDISKIEMKIINHKKDILTASIDSTFYVNSYRIQLESDLRYYTKSLAANQEHLTYWEKFKTTELTNVNQLVEKVNEAKAELKVENEKLKDLKTDKKGADDFYNAVADSSRTFNELIANASYAFPYKAISIEFAKYSYNETTGALEYKDCSTSAITDDSYYYTCADAQNGNWDQKTRYYVNFGEFHGEYAEAWPLVDGKFQWSILREVLASDDPESVTDIDFIIQKKRVYIKRLTGIHTDLQKQLAKQAVTHKKAAEVAAKDFEDFKKAEHDLEVAKNNGVAVDIKTAQDAYDKANDKYYGYTNDKNIRILGSYEIYSIAKKTYHIINDEIVKCFDEITNIERDIESLDKNRDYLKYSKVEWYNKLLAAEKLKQVAKEAYDSQTEVIATINTNIEALESFVLLDKDGNPYSWVSLSEISKFVDNEIDNCAKIKLSREKEIASINQKLPILEQFIDKDGTEDAWAYVTKLISDKIDVLNGEIAVLNTKITEQTIVKDNLKVLIDKAQNEFATE